MARKLGVWWDFKLVHSQGIQGSYFGKRDIGGRPQIRSHKLEAPCGPDKCFVLVLVFA